MATSAQRQGRGSQSTTTNKLSQSNDNSEKFSFRGGTTILFEQLKTIKSLLITIIIDHTQFPYLLNNPLLDEPITPNNQLDIYHETDLDSIKEFNKSIYPLLNFKKMNASYEYKSMTIHHNSNKLEINIFTNRQIISNIDDAIDIYNTKMSKNITSSRFSSVEKLETISSNLSKIYSDIDILIKSKIQTMKNINNDDIELKKCKELLQQLTNVNTFKPKIIKHELKISIKQEINEGEAGAKKVKIESIANNDEPLAKKVKIEPVLDD
jgi:hypothetical protein